MRVSKLIKKYEVDADSLPKMLKVLELIIQFSSKTKRCKKKDMFSTIGVNQYRCAKRIEKHCYDLVIKSIFNHRYEEAAKLYWILCHDKNLLDYAIFKIGIILLLNLETNNLNDCFQTFFRSAINFHWLNKRETLLEFIMCAFKCEFPDIQRQVKEITSKMKCVNKLRKNDQIDSVLDAYILLLEWSKMLTGNMNMSQSQTNQEIMKPRKYDDNSDIFILNLMQVMEIYNKQNEIETELLRYAESNPDNINALIYISTYLYHNHPNSDKLVYFLEILAEKCVSDVRTLWLIEIWRKRGESSVKILKYCFMFLDYPTNERNIEAWKALQKNLNFKKMSEDEFKRFHLLWKSRKRSWLWMYFNPQQLSNTQSDIKLIAYKIAFLLLIGEGNKYIKKALKYHPDAHELAESLVKEI